MQFTWPQFFYRFLQLLHPSLNKNTCIKSKLWTFDKDSTLYKFTLWFDNYLPFSVIKFLKLLPLIRRKGFPTRPIPGYDTLGDCLENLFILSTYLFSLLLWTLLFWYSVTYSTWVIYVITFFYVVNLLWSLKVLSTFFVAYLFKNYDGILFFDFSTELKKNITNSPRTVSEALISIYSSFRFNCLIHFFIGQDYFVTSNNFSRIFLQKLVALIYWNYKLFSAFPILIIKNLTLVFLVLCKVSILDENLLALRHPCWSKVYTPSWEGPYDGFSWRVSLYHYSYLLCKYSENTQLFLHNKNIVAVYSHKSFCTELLVPDQFELQATRYNDDGDCTLGFERSSRHIKSVLLNYDLLGFKFLLNTSPLHRLQHGFTTTQIPYTKGWNCLLPNKSNPLKVLNITFPTCLINFFNLYFKKVLFILINELEITDFTLVFNGKKSVSWSDVKNQDIDSFVNDFNSFYIETIPSHVVDRPTNLTSLDKIHYLVDDTSLHEDLIFNFNRRTEDYTNCHYDEIKNFSIIFASTEHLLLFTTYFINYDPLEQKSFLSTRHWDLEDTRWDSLRGFDK